MNASARGWRPHTEKPAEIPITAIIAVRDQDGERQLQHGIYTFTVHQNTWWNEISGEPLREEVFWWRPEEELLAEIPA